MSIKKILVSQPQPAIIEKSPFFEIVRKHKVEINYNPFNRVQGVSLKEFRGQRVEILTHTAVIFTSRTTVDSFFRICEEARITVPETMKYICQTEAVALYLQKYIVYRKRKIFFADGSFTNFLELIIKHKDEKYMLALSEPHKPELPEALERLKLNVDKVILAKTVQTDVSKLPLAEFDLVALYSPSDVAAFKSAYEGKPMMPQVATFGDATARAAVGAGITINVMAPTPAAPSMTKAIDIYLSQLAAGEEVAPVVLNDNQGNEEFIRTQQAKLAKKTRARKGTAAAAATAKKTTATKSTATKSAAAKKTTTAKSTTKASTTKSATVKKSTATKKVATAKAE